MTCRDIFLSFAKIGAMSLGGGMMMLPLLEQEIDRKRQWLPAAELMEYFALAQGIPGLIAPNAAAMIGHRLRGTRGAVCAVLGVILPSFLIITLIALFFHGFADIPVVQKIFRGLNIAVIALFVTVLLRMGKRALFDTVTVILGLLVFAVYLFVPVNPVFLVIAGALVGLVWGGRAVKS